MINRLIAKDNLWLPATLLGIIFFILYTLLRSQDFLTIDGAIRCFEVMHHEEIFFHSNNHLLYPVYIFLWHKLLALIGVQATDVIQYGHLSQLMNGFFGAATLALFCYLINLITRSPLLSLIIASSYGFSYAFIIHATNAAEPITGLFWSILGILLAYLAIKRSKLWLAFLTGSIFALSLASYQSMVIIAPVALLFCWRSNTINEQFKRPAFSHMLLMSLGGLSGLILIFGWAYHRSGIKDIKEMVKTFFTLAAGGDSTAVYGGIQLTKIVNLPLGFLNNLVHILPKDFTGIRSLITEHRHDTVLIWIILIAIFFGMGLLLLGITAWRLRDKFDAHHRTIVYAGVLGLLLSLFPPFYWGPHYDKLWLQPLFFIF